LPVQAFSQSCKYFPLPHPLPSWGSAFPGSTPKGRSLGAFPEGVSGGRFRGAFPGKSTGIFIVGNGLFVIMSAQTNVVIPAKRPPE
jgi:hypothetical protein